MIDEIVAAAATVAVDATTDRAAKRSRVVRGILNVCGWLMLAFVLFLAYRAFTDP